MKTDDLIAALSRDAAGPMPVGRRIAAALAASAPAAFLLFMAATGPRADLASAAATPLFGVKMLLAATLAIAAIALLCAAARPEGRLPLGVLIVPAGVLVFGLGHELATQMPAQYGARLLGRNWALCLAAIPALAAAPLAAALLAMRAGAPADATLAGALAGLAAGALGAVLYALHCADDSPLFVVTWYGLAIGLVSAAGAVLGRRVLAW